jgi:hypothetical protein
LVDVIGAESVAHRQAGGGSAVRALETPTRRIVSPASAEVDHTPIMRQTGLDSMLRRACRWSLCRLFMKLWTRQDTHEFF